MEKETKRSLLLITFGVVLFALLMHFPTVIKTIQRGIALILPIIVGLILAFVLNVPMKMFEQLFTKIKKKYPKLEKMPVTGVSLFATMACIVLLIGIVYTMFVPGLVTSVKSIYIVFMENTQNGCHGFGVTEWILHGFQKKLPLGILINLWHRLQESRKRRKCTRKSSGCHHLFFWCSSQCVNGIYYSNLCIIE